MAKENYKEMVYQGIYTRVVDGEYKENDILTESMLITEFGVSKSPVREALIELCKDEILKNIPRVGYQVVPVTLKEVIDSLEFRVDIEVAGLRRSFSSISEEQLRALQEIVERHMREEKRDVSQNWSRNSEFHTYLYSLNGNAYAYRMLTQLIRQSSRYISQYFQSAWKRKSESQGTYHMAVVEALAARDIEIACDMLKKDILAVKNEILALHSAV